MQKGSRFWERALAVLSVWCVGVGSVTVARGFQSLVRLFGVVGFFMHACGIPILVLLLLCSRRQGTRLVSEHRRVLSQPTNEIFWSRWYGSERREPTPYCIVVLWDILASGIPET